MYHIWPAQCQIQFCRGQGGHDRKFRRFTMNPEIFSRQRLQFPDSVGRPVRGVDQGPDSGRALPRLEGRLDLAKAGNRLARLGGDRQCLHRAPHQQGFGVRDKRRRHANLAAEPLAEMVAPDRFRNRLARR